MQSPNTPELLIAGKFAGNADLLGIALVAALVGLRCVFVKFIKSRIYTIELSDHSVEARLFGRYRAGRLHYREITEIELQPGTTADYLASLVDGRETGVVRVLDLTGGNHLFFPLDRQAFVRELKARVDAYRKVHPPIFGGHPLYD